MSYTFIELQNMITTDLRENLKISPNEVADIIEYLANLVEGGESVKEYGGVLTPASLDPATSGHKMFAVAGQKGSYGNLIGNPEVLGSVAFLNFDGTEWNAIEIFGAIEPIKRHFDNVTEAIVNHPFNREFPTVYVTDYENSHHIHAGIHPISPSSFKMYFATPTTVDIHVKP